MESSSLLDATWDPESDEWVDGGAAHFRCRVMQPAKSVAKCRRCGHPTAKGEFRLGVPITDSRGPNGMFTGWYHPSCATSMYPELRLLEAHQVCNETNAEESEFLEVLRSATVSGDDGEVDADDSAMWRRTAPIIVVRIPRRCCTTLDNSCCRYSYDC